MSEDLARTVFDLADEREELHKRIRHLEAEIERLRQGLKERARHYPQLRWSIHDPEGPDEEYCVADGCRWPCEIARSWDGDA